MIPEEIVTFLEGATVGYVTTRTTSSVPQLYRTVGWRVGEYRQTITCLFPAGYSPKLIPSLKGNGRFSFTTLGSTTGPPASHPPNPRVDFHECYQFKGEYVASRPASEDDFTSSIEPPSSREPIASFARRKGLGLAICYRIVHEHRGTIEVESGLGKGTGFTLRLPISPR